MPNDRWVDNSGKLGVARIECNVGDIIELCHGDFILTETGDDIIRGFRLSDPDLGKLKEASSGKQRCVDYLHEKGGVQVIELRSASGRFSYIEIGGTIKVHDHASVPMGGPAYATYYSEYEDDEGGGT